VLKIIEFAKKEGFKVKKHYRKIVFVKRKPLFYMLFASSKYDNKPYYWYFPIVGRLGYIGFFNKERAIHYLKELQSKGYDTYITYGSAYSTLGWFDDPLFSTFLDIDDVYLAFLLFHELTHSTYYKKGDTLFNERLANFIGIKTTIKFFRYINDKQNLKKAKLLYHDLIKTGKFYKTAIKMLKSFYSSYSKEYIIRERNHYYQTYIYPLSRKIQKELRIIKLRLPKNINNAFFISKLFYDTFFDNFEKIYTSYNGNLHLFLKAVKREKGK
jgi:predicted aminopeptidase